MKKTITSFIFFWVAIALALTSNTALGNGCIDCHSDPDFYVQERKLHNYYEDWTKSPHKAAGLTCDFCHGGNANTNDKETAHKCILNLTDPKSRLFYKNLPETCGSCHTEKLVEFQKSKHYEALMNGRSAPSCTTCHRAMHPRPHYRDIVEQSCKNCHFEGNPNELPLIADRADEFLHRLSISKVYLNWVTVYYEKQAWPNDTQAAVSAVTEKHESAVNNVHRFDLATMDETTAEILAELEGMFKKAWDEKPVPE